ncbi:MULTISPECIES: DNA-directed RNA polymerase subunit omega [Brevibacillus]|jgi:DNA-directed RNA polymerase subunit omega|uniref:DNA-directed RNA polymerase subunit omega n=1 Tax=Brevibacillus borstelensis AK1 TaxID=1300222 RepID=M8EG00_9BACL|nr:DNA-directed RNA polymerase subunit omega [Brevibacillus borstelensis]EMT54400.1 DNA-directed RNA polymerase omega subunit [Brevibacillus borstelensis AK1]KKX54141.1 DNA-directed RNA polymerase subunit omega [Brevibacillus borstelensis cifa_chp40]MBE5398173.1 DNA-directed RNA polymerase subunit omega [Brevibacillus borstelensis]MCC0564303.1 DNA-directed RNA polymerase subunit omega [Brevibacillus borstelensis]MCM3472952.1 DNA-directed RNA polymerase subunit omega [Brevibacillus borstelensis
MLYPSIDKLTAKAESKYTLVTIASKRARQIRENSAVQVDKPKSKKFVGQALEELIEDKLIHDTIDSRK